MNSISIPFDPKFDAESDYLVDIIRTRIPPTHFGESRLSKFEWASHPLSGAIFSSGVPIFIIFSIEKE